VQVLIRRYTEQFYPTLALHTRRNRGGKAKKMVKYAEYFIKAPVVVFSSCLAQTEVCQSRISRDAATFLINIAKLCEIFSKFEIDFVISALISDFDEFLFAFV